MTLPFLSLPPQPRTSRQKRTSTNKTNPCTPYTYTYAEARAPRMMMTTTPRLRLRASYIAGGSNSRIGLTHSLAGLAGFSFCRARALWNSRRLTAITPAEHRCPPPPPPPPSIPSVTRMRIYARMGRWLLLLRADIKGLMRCKSTCSFSRSLSLSLWARIYRWATSLALGKRPRVRVDLRRYITRRVCAEVCKWRLRARCVWPCRRGAAAAALYVRAPIKGCWWREFVWTWPSCRFCFVVLIINSYGVFTVNG